MSNKKMFGDLIPNIINTKEKKKGYMEEEIIEIEQK